VRDFWIAAGAVLGRDLRLGLRHGSDLAMVVTFFVLATVLFPFGVGPEAALLARISAGVVWVTALLAAMLSLDRLFQADYEDGSLDQLALSPAPLALIVLAKAAAHWLTTGLPLIVVAPALALMLHLEPAGFEPLVLAMLVGTPCLSLFGAIGAALTLGARRGGPLVALLVLPLVLPVLIFGVGAVEAAVTGLGARPHLLILGALLAAALPLAPLATAVALRHALESA
jgi:heme exporter protein B